jgi:hypothetical protein
MRSRVQTAYQGRAWVGLQDEPAACPGRVAPQQLRSHGTHCRRDQWPQPIMSNRFNHCGRGKYGCFVGSTPEDWTLENIDAIAFRHGQYSPEPALLALRGVGIVLAVSRSRRICGHFYDTRQRASISSRWKNGRPSPGKPMISGLSPAPCALCAKRASPTWNSCFHSTVPAERMIPLLRHCSHASYKLAPRLKAATHGLAE